MEILANITAFVVSILSNIVNAFVSLGIMSEEDANEFIAQLPKTDAE
ncbi:MAG: hypothetical protein IJW86_06985 [Clostridia bacterium]|nr:hypothetical protein [Clostridia bacterium]